MIKALRQKQIVAIAIAFLIIILILLFYLKISYPVLLTITITSCFVIVIYLFAPKWIEYQKLRLCEDAYPAFLADFTQAIKSGMTIPQAIKTIAETDYGELSKKIKKLNIWLSWDLPFPEAWQKYNDLFKESNLIQRINGIVLESFYSGGDIGEVLDSLSNNVYELKKMTSERRGIMTQHLIVFYIVFFVLLGIIVMLYKILLPILYLQRFGSFIGMTFSTVSFLSLDYYKNLFFIFTIVQAACLGLISGQIVEEKLIAGLKHIVIMISIALVVFSFAILPAKLTFEFEISPQSVGIGQSVSILGRVYYNEIPAGGAKVDITTPEGLISLTTDSLGQFSTIIKAPLQPGQYLITAIIDYQGTMQSSSKTLIVT
ncbi:MAG: type II secretion system F family protein [Candidatus Nanoarchaeia archaeon]